MLGSVPISPIPPNIPGGSPVKPFYICQTLESLSWVFILASATLAVVTWTVLFNLSVPLFPNLKKIMRTVLTS